MRWDDFRRSDNVEDDRGGSRRRVRYSRRGRPASALGTVIVLGLIGWATGIDPSILIGGAEMVSRGGSQYQQPNRETARRTGAPKDQMGDFVAAVLGNTEDTWTEIFKASNQQYRAPRLRLFAGSEQGGCGFAQAARAVLLSERSAHLSRHPRSSAIMRVRFRGCTGKACEFAEAMWTRTRSAIMYRTSWVCCRRRKPNSAPPATR